MTVELRMYVVRLHVPGQPMVRAFLAFRQMVNIRLFDRRAFNITAIYTSVSCKSPGGHQPLTIFHHISVLKYIVLCKFKVNDSFLTTITVRLDHSITQ